MEPQEIIKTTYDRLPRECPNCHKSFSNDQRWPNVLLRNLVSTFVAIIATAIWLVIFTLISPIYFIPTGILGFFICVFVYGWPGVVMWKVTRSVLWPWLTLRCSSCEWQRKYKIYPESLPDHVD